MQRLAVVLVAIWSGQVACQESAPPGLRLQVDGATDSSAVRVEYLLAGPFGGYRSQLRGSANHIDIPIVVEGKSAQSLKAIIFCAGYDIVRVEIPDLAAQTEVRVALDALAVRRFTGTVEFVNGAKAKSFVLDIEVSIPSSKKFFEIVDGDVTRFRVAEAVVSHDGNFSVVMADLAGDETLQFPGQPSVFQFRARDAATGNFVFELEPREVAIEDLSQVLVLSASPVPEPTR